MLLSVQRNGLTVAVVLKQVSNMDIATTIQETAQSLYPTNSQEWKWRVCKKSRDHQTGEIERHLRRNQVHVYIKVRVSISWRRQEDCNSCRQRAHNTQYQMLAGVIWSGKYRKCKEDTTKTIARKIQRRVNRKTPSQTTWQQASHHITRNHHTPMQSSEVTQKWNDPQEDQFTY